MPTFSQRSNPLEGYRQYVRGLRNGTASYNDDATEQMNRTLFGYEETLRGHEQWNRERRKRFAEDAANIGRLQGLQSNALSLDAQRRTHESGIARTNFMNEADVRSKQLELEEAERLHESDIATQLSKNEREMMDDRIAMLIAQDSLDALERQRDDDAIVKKGIAYSALAQALSGRRVNRSTIDEMNALREEEIDDYDPNVDAIKRIEMGANGQILVTYANDDVLPWQDYRTLLSFGRQRPDFANVIEANLPKEVAQQYRLDRAAQVDRENQERQQAYQERNQQRQELSAFVSSVQKSIANIDKQMESVHNEDERAKLDEQRLALYGDLGKAQEAYKKLHPDIFGEQQEQGGQGANNPLSRAASETGFYGDATVFDSGSNK